MTIVNDYRCGGCGLVQERWTERPAPSSLACGECGESAVRLFAPVGLGGRAAAPARPRPGAPKPSLCTQYPMVPGLCHMSEDAGRMWIAKYKGDSRAIDREQARQETRAAEKPFTTADAITHNHHPTPAPATV